MKKFVLIFICVLVVVATCSCNNGDYVEQGMYGENIKWMLDNEGVLLLKGKGQMLNYDDSNKIPWDSIRTNVNKVVVKNGITNISDYAFYQCSNLVEVDIADSVKSIGEEAFAYCKKLKNINLHNGITNICKKAFYMCLDMQEVNIPNNLVVIEKEVFNGSGLTTIVIPDSVETINEDAFDCRNLTEVYIPSSVKNMYENAFGNGLQNNIKNIYYEGSEEEWKAIEIIETYYGSWTRGVLNILDNTMIHYSCKW